MIRALLFICAAALPGQEGYESASEAFRAERYDEALPAYRRTVEAGGPLALYAAVQAAACEAGLGRAAEAAQALNAFLKEAPDGPWRAMAQARLAGMYARLGWRQRAAELYGEVFAGAPDLWWMYDDRWAAAENDLRTAAHWRRGYAFFRQVALETIWWERRLEAGRVLARSHREADLFEAAEALIRCDHYMEAAPVLGRLLPALAEGGEAAARWRYLHGRFLLGIGLRAEGVHELTGVAERFPASPFAPLAYERAIRHLVVRDAFQDAEGLIDELLALYPESESAGETVLWYVRREGGAWTPQRRIGAYLRLARACPQRPEAGDALLAAAVERYELGQRDGAVEVLRRALKDAPAGGSLSHAGMWLGRLLAQAGKREEAAEVLRRAASPGPGDFHAHRALALLAELDPEAEQAGRALPVLPGAPYFRAFPLPDEPPPDLPEAIAGAVWYARLLFLAEAGLPEAEWEALYHMRGASNRERAYPLLQAIANAGLAHSVNQFADQRPALGLSVTQRARLRYPLAYWRALQPVAAEIRVDPYLLLAMARQESTYRPRLTSHAGAHGLMQVMPGTARWIARVEDEVGSRHLADLGAPPNSLLLGAVYMRRMVERSDGNLALALAAYNAGPGNASAWKRRFGTDDLDAFIERIPFGETRHYVARVLGNYGAYHSYWPD